jgi:hypothetical protein
VNGEGVAIASERQKLVGCIGVDEDVVALGDSQAD